MKGSWVLRCAIAATLALSCTADAADGGNVPERDWLLGSGPLGFRGPWGTTYAPNLRLTASTMTEAEWVKYAKSLKTRPLCRGLT